MPAARYIQTCPVGCAASLETSGIVLAEGPLLRCPECGQLVSQVSAVRYWETMAQFDHTDFNQPGPRELSRRFNIAHRRLRAIAAQLGKQPHDIHLIDVGCSRGQFVASACQIGFNAEGVEPAPHIAAAAQAAGLKVHQGLLEDLHFPDASFDVLTLFEVVEHLKQPLKLLRECHRVLKPGGMLLLSTGNTASWTMAAMKDRWDYFHIEKDSGHISFFNPRSMRLLAERCGFALQNVATRNVRFFEKGDVPAVLYRSAKIAAELLNFPARLFGKGHEMLAYLRRPAGS